MTPARQVTHPFLVMLLRLSNRWHAVKLGLLMLMTLLLAGCASPIVTQVSSFQQWPGNAAGSTFSFLAPIHSPGDLENANNEALVQAELEKLGLRRAAPGQPGRFLVDLTISAQTEQRNFSRPVYQDQYVFRPAFRDGAGRLQPGFWTLDPFGPRYVGNQQIVVPVQISSLRLRLLDTQDSAPNRPRTVFESTATLEGDRVPLPAVMPYLVRSVFEDFPGQNGRVKVVRFDSETGAVIRK